MLSHFCNATIAGVPFAGDPDLSAALSYVEAGKLPIIWDVPSNDGSWRLMVEPWKSRWSLRDWGASQAITTKPTHQASLSNILFYTGWYGVLLFRTPCILVKRRRLQVPTSPEKPATQDWLEKSQNGKESWHCFIWPKAQQTLLVSAVKVAIQCIGKFMSSLWGLAEIVQESAMSSLVIPHSDRLFSFIRRVRHLKTIPFWVSLLRYQELAAADVVEFQIVADAASVVASRQGIFLQGVEADQHHHLSSISTPKNTDILRHTQNC